MVITMAKLRMAHADTYGARKPPGPILAGGLFAHISPANQVLPECKQTRILGREPDIRQNVSEIFFFFDYKTNIKIYLSLCDLI